MRKIWDDMAERLPSPEKEVFMISAAPYSLGQRHRPALSPRQTAGAVLRGRGCVRVGNFSFPRL